jgi:membrane protease YdiL (CAAX protease family)
MSHEDNQSNPADAAGGSRRRHGSVSPGAAPPRPLPYARPIAPHPENPLHLRDVSLRDAALDGSLVFVTAVVVQHFPTLTALFEGPLEPEGDLGAFVVLVKWAEVLLVSALAAYFVLHNRVRPACYGIGLDHLGRQLGWALLTLLTVYAYMIFSALVIVLVLGEGAVGAEEFRERVRFMQRLPLDSAALTVVLMVGVAIGEELLFRGLLLTYVRRLSGSWVVAVAVTSFLFGVLHIPQGLLAVAQITGMAAVLGVFFILSRSLLAVIVAHFLFNLIQVQLMSLLPELQRLSEQLGPGAGMVGGG